MYSKQYTVLCTMYILEQAVQLTVHSVMYSVQAGVGCTVHSVKCSVHCTGYSRLYRDQFTV